MRRAGPITTVLAVLLVGCSSSSSSAPATTPDDPPIATTPATAATTTIATTTTEGFGADEIAALQSELDALASTLPTPDATVIAAVRTRDGRQWTGAAGGGDRADQPVRIASVGKTFTAATIFRLVEDGRLGLDDPAGRHLTPATVELLESDGYDLSAITVRHLLRHTAGLFDYGFGDGSPLLDRALTDQSHRWTRREQLELAVGIGDPLSAPGEAFHYGDTSYVLLGEIIEQITGVPYETAMRELLDYTRLGLDTTWHEAGEPAPVGAPPIARSFFGTAELTALDFSIDGFGGGGIAATTADVAAFYDALLDGRVLRSTSALDEMTAIPPTNLDLTDFGVELGDGAAGLYRLTFDDLGACWAHRGFLGTIALACPARGVTVALTTNVALTDPLPAAVALARHLASE